LAKSQDIDAEDVSVTYTRYPMLLLSTDTTKMFYWGAVSENYSAGVQAERADWDKKIEEEKAARIQLQKDYDAQKNGTKVLNALVVGSGRPADYVAPMPPYFSKIYDTKLFFDSYIKLPGYGKMDNAPVAIEVNLEGYTIIEVKDEKKSEKVKGSDGKETTRDIFTKVVLSKHPMTLKVISAEKGVIFDGYFEATTKPSQNATQTFTSAGELNKYWNANQNSFLGSIDENLTKGNLNMISKFLDDNYGIKEVKGTEEIYTVNSKKADYSDYKNAYSLILDAFSAYNQLSSRNKGMAMLREVAAIYEKALTESNPDDKKARINADVTAATRMNLAVIYLYLHEFDKVESQLNKIKVLDIGKYNRRSEPIKSRLNDMRTRYNACYGA
jgi:hypothetical protein